VVILRRTAGVPSTFEHGPSLFLTADPSHGFSVSTVGTSLSRTVDWYREHPDWWRPLKERLARESKGFWTGS